jgi:hypothetical protein
MKQIQKVLSIAVVLTIIVIIQLSDLGVASAATICPTGYTKNSSGICVKSGTSKVLGSGGGNPGGEEADWYLNERFNNNLLDSFLINSNSSLNLNNQILELGTIDFSNSGLLFGGGTIQTNLINSGLMFLGNDLFTINGNFSNVGGTINEVIGIGGEHGILNVEGNVTLGGALNISLADGFTPQGGQKFLLIDPPFTIGGSFTSITPCWTTVIENNDLYVQYVPEPSTILLVGSGLLGLAGFGMRRRKESATK